MIKINKDFFENVDNRGDLFCFVFFVMKLKEWNKCWGKYENWRFVCVCKGGWSGFDNYCCDKIWY